MLFTHSPYRRTRPGGPRKPSLRAACRLAALAALALCFAQAAHAACTGPAGVAGTREWTGGWYRFCDGTSWQPFANGGSAGACSVAAQMDWVGSAAAHGMCDGANRILLRPATGSGCQVSGATYLGHFSDIDGDTPYEADYTYTLNKIDMTADGRYLITLAQWAGVLGLYDLSVHPVYPRVAGGYFDSTGARMTDANGLVVRGDRVYVGARNNIDAGNQAWLTVLDISDPAGITMLGEHYWGPGARTLYDIALSDDGNYVFGVSYQYESGASGDDLKSWFLVVDATDPADMETVARLDLSSLGTFPNTVKVIGNTAYVAFSDNPGGIATINVTNPLAPAVLDSVFATQIRGADTIAVTADAHYAFLAGRFDSRFAAYDVSNPGDIQFVSRLTNSVFGDFPDITLINNDRIAVVSSPHESNAIALVDVSNPASMSIIQTYQDWDDWTLYRYPMNSVANGRYLYIADSYDSFGRVTVMDMGCNASDDGAKLGACGTPATIDFDPAAPWYRYCDGTDWRPMTDDPCAATSPAPGASCLDGTIYAGTLSGAKIFLAAADQPDSTYEWGSYGTQRSTSNHYDGPTNTAVMASFGAAAHPAAASCSALTAHNHDDWYLPARLELGLADNGGNTIGGLIDDDWDIFYWTSSETTQSGLQQYQADAWRFIDSYRDKYNKDGAVGSAEFRVRCVRRDPPAVVDLCALSPAPGTTCADGSIYAGLSPDGNAPLYMGRNMAGSNLPWGADDVFRGISNDTTGEANTTALAAFGAWAYEAAWYCDALDEHGHTDWYLPAVEEMAELQNNHTAMGVLTGEFWTSTEIDAGRAFSYHIPDAWADPWRGKQDWRLVRCVRKD